MIHITIHTNNNIDAVCVITEVHSLNCHKSYAAQKTSAGRSSCSTILHTRAAHHPAYSYHMNIHMYIIHIIGMGGSFLLCSCFVLNSHRVVGRGAVDRVTRWKRARARHDSRYMYSTRVHTYLVCTHTRMYRSAVKIGVTITYKSRPRLLGLRTV